MQDIQSGKAQPLISFIIAYYNLPTNLLEECIESIKGLALNDDEREIIIVDDGSDTTLSSQNFTQSGQTIYVRQPHAGLSTARNTGIDISHGRYLQFVDADDRLIKNGYDACISLIRRQEADMILFTQTHRNHTSYRLHLSKPRTGADFMRNNNLKASACGYLFRRKILGDLRFRCGILHEDEEFTPLLLLRAETVYTTTALSYFYRLRTGSIVHNMSPEWICQRLDDLFLVILHLRHIAENLPPALQTALKRRVDQLSSDYIYNIIKLTHSRDRLEARLQQMEQEGLFPLPRHHYTWKYSCFQRMTRHSLGRSLLLQLIK